MGRECGKLTNYNVERKLQFWNIILYVRLHVSVCKKCKVCDRGPSEAGRVLSGWRAILSSPPPHSFL